jgi:hypothetical protein
MQSSAPFSLLLVKGKGLPQKAEVAQGVLGRLRPRIVLTFGTTKVVRRQPYTPAAFTPMRNPWYPFLEAELTPGHMILSVATEKIPSVTPPGIDPETVQLVACALIGLYFISNVTKYFCV